MRGEDDHPMRLRFSSGRTRPRTARLLLVGGLVLVVVVAGVVAVAVLRHHGRTPLQEALEASPAGARRVAFTDWAAVRERIAGSADPLAARRVPRLMDRAYDRDLSSASSISDSADALAGKLGFSSGNADWEAYAQTTSGASLVLRMSDQVDLDDVAKRLTTAGYAAPGSDDGVWRGGPDVVARLDPTISPEVQYVVLDRDRHLVVTSQTKAYAASAARVARGEGRSLADSGTGSATVQLAGRAGDLATAIVWGGDFACADLSMSQAAPADEAAAARVVERLGGVSPLAGLVVGERADGLVRVAMGYESDDQAEADLRPRAELVVGQDPSRPQSVGDTYRLTRSRTDGDAVLLDLRPREDVGASLTTITSGSVLFATC